MISKSLFGDRLKEKRKFLGLTQAQAAEKAGIERETWGKYERGVFMPSGDVLLSFLNMGIDVSSLFAAEQGIRPSENSEISKEESELLGYYRQASDNGKFVILSVAKGAEKKAAENTQVSATHKTA